MDDRIEWKCLGDEYLLMRGTARRMVPSELWWKSFTGTSPTQDELQRLWQTGHMERPRETHERELARLTAVVAELQTYVAEAGVELDTLREGLRDGTVTKERVGLQDALLQGALEQLRLAREELRYGAN